MTFRTRNFAAMCATIALLGAGAVLVATNRPQEPTQPARRAIAQTTAPKPNYVTTRQTPGGPAYGYESGQDLIEVVYGGSNRGVRSWLSTEEGVLIFLSDDNCDVGVITAGKAVGGGIIADRTIRRIKPGTPLAAMCADARAGLLRPHQALIDLVVV